MSAFIPSHTSPRPIPGRKSHIPNLSSMDLTTTSATSSISAALSGLNPEDVRLIDEIIERSPRSANSFLMVFKAYNEVLHERGMDASNDVVYYKILLKLGVVKGRDWGTKWRTVKEQQGYGDGDEGDVTPTSSKFHSALDGIHAKRTGSRGVLPAFHRHRIGRPRPGSSRMPSKYERDSVTVHSHQDGISEVTETEVVTDTETETGLETETGTDATEDRVTDSSTSPMTLIHRERASDTKENALRLHTEPSSYPSYPPLPTIDQFLPLHAKNVHSIHRGTSEISVDITTRTSSPPSRKLPPARKPLQPVRQPTVAPANYLQTNRGPSKITSHNESVDEEDTWKKHRMIRDEKEADKFREIMLLERCWEVWKGGLQWLKTMNDKVDEEHGNALLHDFLQKWRSKLHARTVSYQQAGTRHDKHILHNSFAKWRARTNQVQVTKWKDNMRRRMSLIKSRRDERILEDAWMKWRHAHQNEAAALYYERSLVRSILRKWRAGLVKIGRLEGLADEFSQSLEDVQLSRAWSYWKLQADLHETEKVVRLRVDNRVKEDTLRVWKQKMSVNHEADAFRDRLVLKHFYRTWKKSLSSLHAMVHKADKYKNRQDGILLLAVLRMWTARERGLLMDRSRNSQRLQETWSAWKARFTEVRAGEVRALEFRSRPSSALAIAAFTRWHQILLARKNVLSQAEQYDRDVLMHRTLLVWRVQLRMKLKMAKHAKVARKYLLMRQAWTTWRDMVEEKRRERRLKLLQVNLQRKYFERWHAICARQQYHRLAQKQLQVVITTRILAKALTKWTNLVITLKLRELEIVEKRNQKTLRISYDKWKAVFKHHADDLRLMQSYQYVKREEILRRMFSKWHSATKTIRHRRLLLQEKEEDLKLATVEKAWDRWRERYKAERLRPLEYKFAIQSQKSCLYRAYLLWHSKTTSTPAIQFFSSRTKAKFWRIWREAMPKALQAREARRQYRQKLLVRALDKWTQAYRTKIALKAVARARYLRLPSGAPRQSLPLSSALRGIIRSSPSVTSGKATRPASPSLSDRVPERAYSIQEADSASRAGSTGGSRRRLLALRATKLSIARPTYGSHDVSREGSTDLWHDLRRGQKKPMSERE